MAQEFNGECMLSGHFNTVAGTLKIEVIPLEPPNFTSERQRAVYELACQKSVLDAVQTRISYLEGVIGDHEMTVEMVDINEPKPKKRW